ncbi:1,6-anhydro-N-acetylmuramyl-L-alanine amidase AmpD [Niveibacterium sp. 24ML]|uniref:1,6-anhydro-N-acetylmuramyl-L-alanine amidase AmpD n=1 Tax=Niveibacterium sp. 24ML TaxID=2985512 RepID=UPI00226D81B7|nr:1,6-anhydro-N-acetylmuramyl-L-alanine amidase AmpD [Niveibacterium sp. 24ML]MCX9156979.1 1,6-anhydro-N-acetylmuramyl-L-alanine amidase AmpD [Niveibacterium sp. 24ML]
MAVKLRGEGLIAPLRPAGPRFAAIGPDGWLPGVRWIASPNCDERPGHEAPSLIVIHAISLPPECFGGPGVAQLFTNCLDPDAHPYYAQIHHLRVSAHFLIRRDGSVEQFVATTDRAWHAGVSSWAGRERCNDFSVGIELEGSDTQPFDAAQYPALAELILRLAERHPVSEIAAHSDIAPGRKTDPGPCFDWPLLSALLR